MIALIIIALFVALCLLGAAFIVRDERQPVERVQTVYRTQPMPAYAAKYFEQQCTESELEQLQRERWQD